MLVFQLPSTSHVQERLPYFRKLQFQEAAVMRVKCDAWVRDSGMRWSTKVKFQPLSRPPPALATVRRAPSR